ncbi:MAG: hypothetical protein WDO13_17470 [Verrucomicrobiota bacterium]
MPLVLAGPFFFSASTIGLLTNVGIYMLLAVGLNITVGMTGLLVLGYAGFFGFGAYLFALGQRDLGYFPWWLAAVLAFPLGGAIGYLLGLPCLRLRGDYLAIVTLGFAEAFRETIRNLDFTGGDQGIIIRSYAMFQPVGRLPSGRPWLDSAEVCYLGTALILFPHRLPRAAALPLARRRRVDRHSRKRDRRRVGRRARGADEAARLLPQRRHRRRRRRRLRRAGRLRQPRVLRVPALHHGPGHGHPRPAWATTTARCSARPCSTSCPSTSRSCPRPSRATPRSAPSSRRRCSSPSPTSPITACCSSAPSWC